jgi:hypothetical protein
MAATVTPRNPDAGPIKVEARRVGPGSHGPATAPPHADLQADLARARRLAHLLDQQFSIRGYRFGLDALVGLIPGVGDLLGALAGLYPLLIARRHGLGRIVQSRMALNLLIELGVGAIPVLGDAFDFGFKANVRNVELLERAAAKKPGHPPRHD